MQFAGADKIGGDGAAAAAEAADKRKRKNTDKAAKTTNTQLKEGRPAKARKSTSRNTADAAADYVTTTGAQVCHCFGD